jgi:hypothetical protein
MNRLIRVFLLALLLPLLHACVSMDPSQRGERVPIPGGVYSWGTSQKAEDFGNVEVAQSRLLLYPTDPGPWRAIVTQRLAYAQVSGLQWYLPMQARWKLKDGREFILESIDQATLVRDYAKTRSLPQTQWEREGRKATVGDGDARLAHDIKDDTLRLKWIIPINKTPVNERLRPSGAANPWDREDEEHVIAVIKGVPTSDIDFSNKYDLKK